MEAAFRMEWMDGTDEWIMGMEGRVVNLSFFGSSAYGMEGG
jgi:hypothetical protein